MALLVVSILTSLKLIPQATTIERVMQSLQHEELASDSLRAEKRFVTGSRLVIETKTITCYGNNGQRALTTDSLASKGLHSSLDSLGAPLTCIVTDISTSDGATVLSSLADISYHFSSDSSRGCIIARKSTCYDSLRSVFYVVDIHNPELIDSGSHIEVVSSVGIATISREGWPEHYPLNYFVLGQGTVLQWNDSLLTKMYGILFRKKSPTLVIQEEEDAFRLFDPAKKVFNDLTFSAIYPSKGVCVDTSRFKSVAFQSPSGEKWVKLDMETGDISCSSAVIAHELQWWYGSANKGNYIDRLMFTTIENRHPTKHIDRALMLVTISNKSTKKVYYHRKHWVTLNLAPGEVGPSILFRPDEKIHCQGLLQWNAECLEFE